MEKVNEDLIARPVLLSRRLDIFDPHSSVIGGDWSENLSDTILGDVVGLRCDEA
jgi:hypothetical protein